jgi:integrase
MSQKLTDRIVRTLEPPAKGNRITYDTDVSGFGARITAAGAVSFILNYRRRSDGLERRYTIGRLDSWSVAAAREEARRLRRDVDSGGDPIGDLQVDRAAPTVADLCERFLIEHVGKKRASTARDYKAIVAEIKAKLGSMKVAAVDYEHIDRLHREVSKRAPYRANRTLAVLSKAFTLAIRWRWRTDNPCKGVERNPEQKRKRYLSAAELVRLSHALEQHGGQSADVFRLLLLTGARTGEALAATWSQFNDDYTIWTKPAAAVKQAQDHVVPLSAPASALLARVREQQSVSETLVFPGRRGHRSDTKHSWQKICAAARITGLRVHDLRHTYASVLASAGQTLPIIGALLGHSSPITTHRYAHLFDDPLRAATERASAFLTGKARADVVSLKRRTP